MTGRRRDKGKVQETRDNRAGCRQKTRPGTDRRATLQAADRGDKITYRQERMDTAWDGAPSKSLYISAGISEQSVGARNRVGRGLLYRHARLHRQVTVIP